MSRESLTKTIAVYSSSNIYRRLCGLVNTFIKPKLLSPENYGLWSFLTIILTYATYAHLGARDAMHYAVPEGQAAGKDDRVTEVISSVFYGALGGAVLIAAATAAAALLGEWDSHTGAGLMAVALLVLLQVLLDYRFSHLKAFQDFPLLSRANVFQATVAVLCNVVLISAFGLYGLYGAAVLSVALTLFYLRRKRPLNFSSGFDGRRFRSLVRRGFPIMTFNFILVLIGTADRMIVFSMLGKESLGYYALAALVMGFLMDIPKNARHVLEPKLMEASGDGNDPALIREYLHQPLIHLAYGMPLLIGVAYFALPAFIRLVLPDYAAGIAPAQILVVGSFFFALSLVPRGLIVKNGWQGQVVWLMLAAFAVNVAVSLTLLRLGYGLPGVAFGSALAYGVLYAELVAFLRIKYRGRPASMGRWAPAMWLPFPAMLVALVVSEALAGLLPLGDVAVALLQLVAYLGLMTAFIRIARNRFDLPEGLALGFLFARLRRGLGI